MSELRIATASNVLAFQNLSNALNTNNVEWTNSIDHEALEDEMGRFRVWSGNLGALQKGHSSLDYRLRDSPLLSSNALKFLKELEDNLHEAYAIVSGARLPYEQQPKPEKDEEDEEDDDDFFSEDEDEDLSEDGSKGPRTELSMRFNEIIDIIDNLYKLSVRIRTPTIRSRSLKAASYKPKDLETGVDILSRYAKYDLLHITELLSHLRQPHLGDEKPTKDYLSERLGAAITLRRRQFKYWKRHRDKLGASAILEDMPQLVHPSDMQPEPPIRDNTLEAQPENPAITLLKAAPTQKTGRTLLSGTEVTHHHQSLDDIVDSKSVTSYAVTVKDINGKGIDLPPPPKAATGDKDFECPYCYIICPARYGRGRAWRTHVLQDLQPYCCTYSDCDRSEQLFRSRREWIDHEASHRKAWRCPEHSAAVYKSQAGLEDHLRQRHMDSFPESQFATIVKVGETSTVDVRQTCPICLASADMDGMGDFQSHIANHLERIATFALPNGMDGESDGASSAASRGRSGSTGSQEISNISSSNDTTAKQELQELCMSDADITQNNRSPESSQILEPARDTLSAATLHQLPDSSQNRLDMIADQLGRTNEFDDSGISEEDFDGGQLDEDQADVQQSDETPADFQKHLEQRDAFKSHLMSLPGALSVRFYRRYGSWTGRASFRDEAVATEALKVFDHERFPIIRLQQGSGSKEIRFSAPNISRDKKGPPARRSTANTLDAQSISSGSISYENDDVKHSKQSILSTSDIPTLRSLYRSRRLLQRDQSYAPNDSYNGIISFCYHDLTRLKIDAIVNSANTALKVTRGVATLNNSVHRAAGPGLAEEMKSKSKIKPGQVELTHGHDLPASWIIHAARPQYFRNKGMGQFNVLTECYRSVLKMAHNYEFKSMAFPCLGAGGCGFPPRVAARIALQEIREDLDAHPDYVFERIIICVNTAIDEKAYMDFFPVFFPPTHGDLDRARTSEFSASRAALAAQILETRGQVQKVNEALATDFSLMVPEFDDNILKGFSGIDASLASIRGFLLGSKELTRSLGDLNLICSVMLTICGSVSEITELAKDTAGDWETHKRYWDEFNRIMQSMHATDLAHLLVDCQDFVRLLDDILTNNGIEPDEMAAKRQRLESYGSRQKGQDAEGIRDHLDEVLYAREFQREAATHNRNTVRLHQIPSIAKLYQLNELASRPTLAQPSAIFNQTVCLVREDITQLEVDIMVNSTDESFMGMGTLDRSVFKKGGPELGSHIRQFGKCEEGAIKLTPGYMLPAKHILHVVPPDQYRKNTKAILRGIYRDVLHMAMSMRAISVALPSIGTGMLNYPRRDCASLAMEEVKRFLESAEPTSMIEKIIFVVYSSNDDFIYKSLLPIYFPPEDYTNEPLSPSQSQTTTRRVSIGPTVAPRRTLFGSISEAFRGIGSSKQPEITREVNSYEEHALIGFESHARDCPTCKDVDKVYAEGRDLCRTGYAQGQLLLWHMNMVTDQTIYAKPDKDGQSAKLKFPTDLFPISQRLLFTIEKSFRDKVRQRPFVSPNQNYSTIVPDDEKVNTVQSGGTFQKESAPLDPTRIGTVQAEVTIHSNLDSKWYPILYRNSTIHIYPGKVCTPKSDELEDVQAPSMSLRFTSDTKVARPTADTVVTVSGALDAESQIVRGTMSFRSRTPAESEELLEMLQRATNGITEPPGVSNVTEHTQTTKFVGATDLGVAELPGESFKSVEPESHSKQDQKLQNLQTELDGREQGGGRFSRLHSRLKSLTQATSSMSSSSRRSSSFASQSGVPAKVPDEFQQKSTQEALDELASLVQTTQVEGTSPLAAEILAHLTSDLQTRPGSYIGQKTSAIASALGKPVAEVSAVIEVLAANQQVHNTVDVNTWVISHPPTELPSLPQQQTRTSTPGEPSPQDAKEDTIIITQRVLSYLEWANATTLNETGQTIRDIAAALQLPTTAVWPAIRNLAARRLIRQSHSNAQIWVLATTAEQVPHSATPSIRNTPSFTDTPPSPRTQPLTIGPQHPALNLDTLNLDDFYTYPTPFGARWTRIDKRLVDARVLSAADEEFDDGGNALVVHRVLRRGEIRRWAEESRVLREKDGKARERSESPGRRRGGDVRGTRGESWRVGRGEKDRRQAKLDRVLAGDMVEDELRHYADEDGERRTGKEKHGR